jgi:phosphatidylglycerol:prolipoprotein diacylglycerol transferase
MQPPFDPILFSLGPISVHWYGILIVTGILLGSQVAGYLAKQYGRDPEAIWDMLMIVVILAIVGARVYHVFSQPESGLLGWQYYKENPIEVFFIWNGGLGIYGALIGGAVGVAIYAHFHQLRLLRWLDFIAPGAAIGQSIGRWGNYMNRELYGPPTTLPWGLEIPPLNRIAPYNDLTRYPPDTLFHPTFLYESLATLGLCLALIWIATRFRAQLREGDLLGGYLMGYAIIRFFIEYLRPDAWMMGTLAAAQVFAIALFAVSVVAVAGRRLVKPAAADAA